MPLSSVSAPPVQVQAALVAVAPDGVWTGPFGVVRIEIEHPGGDVEEYSVRFGPTGAALDPGAEPEARLRIPAGEVNRLVSGESDGALLHLANVLRISGDERLVLELGTSVTNPGTGRPLVDPRALDPVAVSRAIAGVPTEHLAAVMSGGFRSLVLREVFNRMPEFLIEEKAARVRVAIGFTIGGRPDSGTDRYVVRVADGACTVESDPQAGTRVDATLVLDGHEFLRLVLGHLNPVRGVLSGEIKVEGQLVKALGFNSVMRTPED